MFAPLADRSARTSDSDLAAELLTLAQALRALAAPQLVPVRVVRDESAPAKPSVSCFRLAFGPYQVAIPPGFDERDLSRLLALLRSTC